MLFSRVQHVTVYILRGNVLFVLAAMKLYKKVCYFPGKFVKKRQKMTTALLQKNSDTSRSALFAG